MKIYVSHGARTDGQLKWFVVEPQADPQPQVESLRAVGRTVIELDVEEHVPCTATIWHGPGHQSRTRCQVEGPHEIHEATYGSMRQWAQWRGAEINSGFFDEPPRFEEES